ncbi:hypothetical protein ABW21_db0201960 [Orbilia brochopaga]|nr:hypothetical protein ABW21_db0201960 [Drechslerella brochopaga]
MKRKESQANLEPESDPPPSETEDEEERRTRQAGSTPPPITRTIPLLSQSTSTAGAGTGLHSATSLDTLGALVNQQAHQPGDTGTSSTSGQTPQQQPSAAGGLQQQAGSSTSAGTSFFDVLCDWFAPPQASPVQPSDPPAGTAAQAQASFFTTTTGQQNRQSTRGRRGFSMPPTGRPRLNAATGLNAPPGSNAPPGLNASSSWEPPSSWLSNTGYVTMPDGPPVRTMRVPAPLGQPNPSGLSFPLHMRSRLPQPMSSDTPGLPGQFVERDTPEDLGGILNRTPESIEDPDAITPVKGPPKQENEDPGESSSKGKEKGRHPDFPREGCCQNTDGPCSQPASRRNSSSYSPRTIPREPVYHSHPMRYRRCGHQAAQTTECAETDSRRCALNSNMFAGNWCPNCEDEGTIRRSIRRFGTWVHRTANRITRRETPAPTRRERPVVGNVFGQTGTGGHDSRSTLMLDGANDRTVGSRAWLKQKRGKQARKESFYQQRRIQTGSSVGAGGSDPRFHEDTESDKT